MPKNKSLHEAKMAKNDEFYTQYVDIEREMNAYIEYNPDVFRDKTILLPCDDPEWSNFTKYFAQNFERFGIRKLISTSYAADSKPDDIPYQLTLFETESPKYDKRKTRSHGKIFTLTRDINKDKKINIEDLEWEYLKGDGDFRSDEIKKLRDEADIIITNPPFSLFREFLQWLTEKGDKQFVTIANKNAITYKELFKLIEKNKLWVGKTPMSVDLLFRIPDSYVGELTKTGKVGSKYRIVGGEVLARAQAIWLTNIDHGRRHQPLRLMTMNDNLKYNTKLIKKLQNDYNVDTYPKYYNYDAIEIPYTEAIPSDYDGIMGVPISFLDKFCPEQFNIIGFDGNEYAEELGIKAIGREWVDLYRSQGGTGHISPSMHSLVLSNNGKAVTIYKRILIKAKESQ